MNCCSEDKLSRRCVRLLFADRSHQSVVSPTAITDAVLQLEALLNKLEQAVANVMNAVDNKRQVIFVAFVYHR